MPATKQVDVEVKDALASLRMRIDNDPETVVLHPFLFGNPFSQINHFGDQLWWCLQNGGHPFLRNYQDVNGSLGIFVSNGESVFRLGYVTLGGDIFERTGFRVQLRQLLRANLSRCCYRCKGKVNECESVHERIH